MTPTPLVWKSVCTPQEGWTTDMLRAKSLRDSEWTLYPERERRGQMPEIHYRAPVPEGETGWVDYMLKTKDEDLDRDDEETDLRFARTHSCEIGRIVNQQHGKRLIEMLDQGSEGLGDARSILLEVMQPYSRSDRHPNWYELDIGKGGIHVEINEAPEVGISFRYDPNNSRFFHYMLLLYGDQRSHDNTRLIRRVWPDGCADPVAVAARFIVDELIPWVKNNRMRML